MERDEEDEDFQADSESDGGSATSDSSDEEGGGGDDIGTCGMGDGARRVPLATLGVDVMSCEGNEGG